MRRAPSLPREAALSVALTVGLVALLVLTVAVLGRDGGTAAARPTARAPSTSAAAPTTVRIDPSTDPRTDGTAPRSRPSELLRVLADARAAAWREATPALLVEADAPRSAVAARDAAAVAEVAQARLRYAGLRYTVAEVTTISTTPDRAVLRARIDSSAYSVAAAAGSTSRPAVSGTPVLVDLVRTDVGWRLSDLRPVP